MIRTQWSLRVSNPSETEGAEVPHPPVTSDTSIEDLIQWVPDSVGYLREKGVRCIRCGEPIWGSLAEAAKQKGFGDDDVELFVRELNAMG